MIRTATAQSELNSSNRVEPAQNMIVHADLNAEIASMFFGQTLITTYKNQNKLCVFRITLNNN